MRSMISRRDGADLPSPAMDIQDALSRLGGDKELLTAIVEIYLEDSPTLIERIHKAVASTDAKALQVAAHNLKGLAATLSAADVASAASRLEHMGASRNMTEAIACLAELQTAAAELTTEAKGRLTADLRPHRH